MRVLLLASAAALLLAGCAAPSPPASPPQDGGANALLPEPARVAMVGGEQGNFFDPAHVSVTVGRAVTWTGQSGHHTVTFQQLVDGNSDRQDSGDIAPGQDYVVAFPTPGTYAYRCRYHSSDFGAGKGMTGTVTVT